MAKYDSKKDTLEHKVLVSHFMFLIIKDLMSRIEEHDKTKMEEGEIELFDEYTPKLKDSTYGSPEYQQFLKDMKPALDHHYARYRHHPEHFPDGIDGMNLADLIEMLCDWKASSMRHQDGNILKSIELNKARFNYDSQINKIFINTVKDFFERGK